MNPKLNSYMLDAEIDSMGKLMKLKYGIASYPIFIDVNLEASFKFFNHPSIR
jgi:hypothetical protein